LTIVSVWRLRQQTKDVAEGRTSDEDFTRRMKLGYGLALGWGIGGIFCGLFAILVAHFA